MSIMEILKIFPVEQSSEQLLEYSLEQPRPGEYFYTLPISGWVLGRNEQVISVNLVYKSIVLQNTPVTLPRYDVARHYPNVPWAERCGFSSPINMLGIAPEFEILLQAVLQSGNRLDLAVLQGRRQPLHSAFQPKLRPLLVTSWGRSGTVWMMHLLAQHPQIVVHQVYPYELRAFTYWMEMLLNSIPTDPFSKRPFIESLDTSQLRYWLGRIYIERLAFFCQQGVEAIYQQIAKMQDKSEPVYFAEKNLPSLIPMLMWELYPQAREIFLIRDLRDIVCSARAFSAKHGYKDFGYQFVTNDEEYIWWLRQVAMVFLESWQQRADKAILIRYEDLILYPVETLTTIFSYLGLDHTPSKVQNIIQKAEKAAQESFELKNHRTSLNPKASIQRWRHELNPRLQKVCQEAFGDFLKEFGYAV